MAVYIPLRPNSKVAAVTGWSDEDYRGTLHVKGDWNGLRCDNIVVVDCDSFAAQGAWLDRAGHPASGTYTVKTPRGYHNIYEWTPGSPTGPLVGVYKETDIRAGRGSYIVAPGAVGYQIYCLTTPMKFNPAWLPAKAADVYADAADEWDEVPEGRRNNVLASVGGALRKQGASVRAIARSLAALNSVIIDDPLDIAEVRQIALSVSRYRPQPDQTFELVD